MLNYLSLLFLSKTLIAQTGDESNTEIWFIIMGVAGVLIIGALIFMLVRGKKASKSEKETSGKKRKYKSEPEVSEAENEDIEE